MQRTPRALGTNRDMAHGNQRPTPSRDQSDRAVLRAAARETRQWQERLAKQRRAEQQARP